MIKSKRTNEEIFVITIIAMGVIFCVFLLSQIPNINADKDYNIPPINYVGSVQLGIINPVYPCTHSLDSYKETNIGLQDKTGNKYILLESKFGDEFCFNKIN